MCIRDSYAVREGGGQAALMAPTEILARQHYEKLVALFGPERVRLLLGGMKASARTQAWEELSSGQAGIAVGTHALLRQEGMFSNLQLIVTDEQHRFGAVSYTHLDVYKRQAYPQSSLQAPRPTAYPP